MSKTKEKCIDRECPLQHDNPGKCPFVGRINVIETNIKWLIRLVGIDLTVGTAIGILAAYVLKVIGG